MADKAPGRMRVPHEAWAFIRWIAIVVGGLILTGVALAQVSTNYDLSWHLLSGGGGSRRSANYAVGDSLGQWVGQASSSAAFKVEPGFWPAFAAPSCSRPLAGVSIEAPTGGYVDTAYSFVGVIDPDDATAPVLYDWSPEPDSGQGSPGATYRWATAGAHTVTLTARNCGGTFVDTHTIDIRASGSVGDAYEVDDTCQQASTIFTDGTPQTHNFHLTADQDWIKVNTQANKTYIIQTANVGQDHDAVLYLYDACDAPSLGTEHNAFGHTVRLEWNSTSAQTYYLMLKQFDPQVYGESTQYDISVAVDTTPPSTPRNPRSAPGDNALVVQWKRSPEFDVVGYDICWSRISGTCAGIEDVDGPDTTYYELGDLNNGDLYYLRIRAEDFSGNRSDWTAEISNVPAPISDGTIPSVTVSQPTMGATYSTTLSSASLGGTAQDAGGNLSRVQVHNVTQGTVKWDYGLSGSTHPFHVENLGLNLGDNAIQVTAYDDAGNPSATRSLTIRRLEETTGGAAIIVAGHNEAYGLQSNIYNAANRAYRLFSGAGYGDEAIYYLAPTSQAPFGDGIDRVDGDATVANLQSAIQTWAAGSGRVGPGKPLHIYLMDHGEIEAFCVDGCNSSGRATSTDLNSWLNALETATGANTVNVIIEACHSGSFIDRVNAVAASISKAGRVVIASTDRANNAYASAQGAYFSDAFFSCIVGSGSLKTCYDQAATAVGLAGQSQIPWLDDNGDGLSNAGDGAVAQNRYIATAFGSSAPTIQSASVSVQGGTGTLTAQVERGAEQIDVVWAAVYAPSFQEPTETTLNLGVPVVLLQKDPEQDGRYTAAYPGGFAEGGKYRVLFYAQDRVGTHAQPKRVFVGESQIFMPLIRRP